MADDIGTLYITIAADRSRLEADLADIEAKVRSRRPIELPVRAAPVSGGMSSPGLEGPSGGGWSDDLSRSLESIDASTERASGSLEKLAATLAKLHVPGAEFVGQVAQIQSGLSGLNSLLPAAGEGFKALSAALTFLTATPVGLAITAIGALVAVLISAREEGESLDQTFARATNSLLGLKNAQDLYNQSVERQLSVSKILKQIEEDDRRAEDTSAQAAERTRVAGQREVLAEEMAKLEEEKAKLQGQLDALKTDRTKAAGRGAFIGFSSSGLTGAAIGAASQAAMESGLQALNKDQQATVAAMKDLEQQQERLRRVLEEKNQQMRDLDEQSAHDRFDHLTEAERQMNAELFGQTEEFQNKMKDVERKAYEERLKQAVEAERERLQRVEAGIKIFSRHTGGLTPKDLLGLAGFDVSRLTADDELAMAKNAGRESREAEKAEEARQQAARDRLEAFDEAQRNRPKAEFSGLEEFSRRLQLAAINDPAEKEAQSQRKALVEETKKQTVILDGIKNKPAGTATFG